MPAGQATRAKHRILEQGQRTHQRRRNVISAYVLSFAALQLVDGYYADRHGRKRTTLIGLVVFAVTSGLCGLAPLFAIQRYSLAAS